MSIHTLVLLMDDCKHLFNEVVWRGEHRLVSVPIEGNDTTVRERVIDRGYRIF